MPGLGVGGTHNDGVCFIFYEVKEWEVFEVSNANKSEEESYSLCKCLFVISLE